ncbi:hypothetical protein [Lentibacillus sp. Marseille-P4043]|uniref:hypothetical protein n=1 Tax=Lentibacillus sp. Marseille-P4043 TaxID=2040293 RepID=UPI000D0B6597|nr:hypothetical protein [Lentibacillus sp. Marseille-P4043]
MYNSDFYNNMFANDNLFSPLPETLQVKENVLGGISLTTGNGTTVMEGMPDVTGGMNAMFANGETATIKDNIYGGTTVDMTGVENDIVGRPTIFGGESYTQGGEYVGTLSPDLLGDGYQFTAPTGETLLSTSTSFDGGTQLDFNSFATTEFGETTASAFDVGDAFYGIDAISSQISVADFGSGSIRVRPPLPWKLNFV